MRLPLTVIAATAAVACLVPAGSAVAKSPSKPRTVKVRMTAITKSVLPVVLPDVEDRGTITGTPLGKGTLDLFAHFEGTHVTATFTIRTAKGKVMGTADLTAVIAPPTITFTGTSTITGGTKAYKGITGSGLKVVDTNTLDGQNGRVTMTGKVRLPR